MTYLSGSEASNQYNDTKIVYGLRPYGPTGYQIFLSFLFMVWIIIANTFLVFLIFKDKTLRHQPHNIYVVFICLVDLLTGLYYLPINMAFLARGYWDHDCLLLNSWAWLFTIQICACTFTIGFLNFGRMCSSCLSICRSPGNLTGRCILHGTSLFLILIPPVFICLQVLPANYIIYQYPTCNILSNFKYTERLFVIFQAFWVPMYFALVFLAVALYRLTRFDAPEKVNPDMTQVPLKVLVLVTLVSLVLPGPFLMLLSNYLPPACVYPLIQVPEFTCNGSVAGLYIFLQWVMISKSGVLPLSWFAGKDYRNAARLIVQKLRPLWRYVTMLRRSDRPADEETITNND